MSTYAMLQVIEAAPQDIRGSEYNVLLMMADSADDAGDVSLYMASLAVKSHISVDQCRRLVRKLQDAGHIELLKTGGPSADLQGRPSLYRISPALMVAEGRRAQAYRSAIEDGTRVDASTGTRVDARVKIEDHSIKQMARAGAGTGTRVDASTGTRVDASTDGVDGRPVVPVRSSPEEDAAGLVQLVAQSFMYLDREPLRVASQLTDTFAWSILMEALTKTKEAHQEKISSGDRGIMAPLAYMRTIAAEDSAPVRKAGGSSANVVDIGELMRRSQEKERKRKERIANHAN